METLGFTIDTIKLFINWEKLEGFDYNRLKKIIKSLKNWKNDNKTWYEGRYENFQIRFSEGVGIFITGSISNYYCGAKYLLLLTKLKLAIEKLGCELGISHIDSARLYRIDLALNIQTDYPIEQYSHRLFTDLKNFKKLEQDDGVRFENRAKKRKNKSLVFAIYNKGCDLQERKNIDNDFNILRLELRLLKKVSKILGIKGLEIKHLYQHENIKKLVNLFDEFYFKIKKQTIPKDYDEIKHFTPTILKNYIQSLKLQTIGGESNIYKVIEQADLDRKFKTRNDKSRCRKYIEELSNNEFVSKQHPLVDEIDEKVKKSIDNIIIC